MNTKCISSSAVKKSVFSRVHTSSKSENADIFIARDTNAFSKKSKQKVSKNDLFIYLDINDKVFTIIRVN